jgi:hypothetical protein
MQSGLFQNSRAYCPHEPTIRDEFPSERGARLGSSYFRHIDEQRIDRMTRKYLKEDRRA